MKYEIRHEFDVSADALLEAMMHPEITAFLMKNMKSLQEMELLEKTADDATIRRRVRYRILPVIEKIGPKSIPPEVFEWVEESTLDRAKRVMVYRNIPTRGKIRKRFENSGEIRILDLSGNKSARVMTGELKISFPLLGGVAEKIICKKATEILEEEAAALKLFLKDR